MLKDFWRWGQGAEEVLDTIILLTCSPERVSWLPFPTSPGRPPELEANSTLVNNR